jgi:GNAT superfamily N-acetyltransferase
MLALIERIERAEAELMTSAASAAHGRGEPGFVMPLAGGVATCAGPDSPFTKVAGLGFAGVPAEADLAEVERAFAALGAPVQVELPHVCDPAISELLTARGYGLVGFEDVLARRLDREREAVAPPGVEVAPIGDDLVEAWLEVVAEGVAHPDTEGAPAHQEFAPETVLAAERDLLSAGATPYLARRDGAVAGGGSVRFAGPIAQLTGAATAPPHRRRGVQAALLAARLDDAAAAGCEVAVVTTQPASKSQENVQRRGFALLYTRAVLRRR